MPPRAISTALGLACLLFPAPAVAGQSAVAPDWELQGAIAREEPSLALELARSWSVEDAPRYAGLLRAWQTARSQLGTHTAELITELALERLNRRANALAGSFPESITGSEEHRGDVASELKRLPHPFYAPYQEEVLALLSSLEDLSTSGLREQILKATPEIAAGHTELRNALLRHGEMLATTLTNQKGRLLPEQQAELQAFFYAVSRSRDGALRSTTDRLVRLVRHRHLVLWGRSALSALRQVPSQP